MVSKILRIQEREFANSLVTWSDQTEVTTVADCDAAIELVAGQQFDGIFLDGGTGGVARTIHSNAILDCIPLGVALLDLENRIVSVNRCFTDWFGDSGLTGQNFYDAIGRPLIVGDEPSPLNTVVATKTSCETEIQSGDRYFMLAVTPIIDERDQVRRIVVSLRESTVKTLQRKKLEALHDAGSHLADLRPDEIYQLEIDERKALLKDNIIHFTKSILDFDVIEVRRLNFKTMALEPLVSVGMDSGVADRTLYATEEGNGVTGYVGATGVSYLCNDTSQDSRYLDGLMGAKSSLTVALKDNDQIIGTFNIESPETRRFDQTDQTFVECFAHHIATALNTLDLLNAQQTDTAMRSVERIRAAIALPVDDIMVNVARALENFVGQNPEVTEGLHQISYQARKIKRMITQVGEELAVEKEVAEVIKLEARPKLNGKRILVVDVERDVRFNAHKLLEKHGCDVESASTGQQALMMVSNSGIEEPYDVILADIHLPDIGGCDLLLKLRDLIGDDPPLILMRGFGYDPKHEIVRAREAGLKHNAMLAKPFRSDLLLETVESIACGPDEPGFEDPGK